MHIFKKEEKVPEKQAIEIIRDTIDVDAAGTVRFRSRTGRGSGKAVEIPGDQFDEFVSLMLQAQKSREDVAEMQRNMELAEANKESVVVDLE